MKSFIIRFIIVCFIFLFGCSEDEDVNSNTQNLPPCLETGYNISGFFQSCENDTVKVVLRVENTVGNCTDDIAMQVFVWKLPVQPNDVYIGRESFDVNIGNNNATVSINGNYDCPSLGLLLILVKKDPQGGRNILEWQSY